MTERSRLQPIEQLESLAVTEVDIGPDMRHIEIYTMKGLLTVLWHGPDDATDALVLCSGGMGGLLGPAEGLYQRLGEHYAARGVATLRLSYRRPSDLQDCVIDAGAVCDLGVQRGLKRFVAMGHSFGGAVAINIGLALSTHVAGVCCFATQSAGCERVGGLAPRPLLFLHGDADRILGPENSSMVHMMGGGHGEVIVLAGNDHLLNESRDVVEARTIAFVDSTLGLDPRP